MDYQIEMELLDAIGLKDLNEVRLILSLGPDLEFKQDGTHSILDYAITTGGDPYIIEELLNAGANPNGSGKTSTFHSLIFQLDNAGRLNRNYRRIFELFLDAGANLEEFDSVKMRPLDHATDRLRPLLENIIRERSQTRKHRF